MDIIEQLRTELKIEKRQAEAAVRLIDEGCTIPFISRYRKEATGALNDEQLRNLDERLKYLRTLEEKKHQVLSAIEEQGKLNDVLRTQILEAQTQVAVEDLYRPYRPKRRTRASIAREKGLEGLARLIGEQKVTIPLTDAAKQYIVPEKGVKTVEDALQGAKDILAEDISDNAAYRLHIREMTMAEGLITSSLRKELADKKEQTDRKEAADRKEQVDRKEAASGKDQVERKNPADGKAQVDKKKQADRKEQPDSTYEMYYQFQEPVGKIAGHRILALNRGEAEKVLTVKVEAPEERILRYLKKKVIRKDNPVTSPVLEEVVTDSYERLIAPAIEREVRGALTEKAQEGAISVFGKNLEQLLMQPPIAGKVVMGWDPAFRTGCKLAVVDPTGKVLDTKVIYPTAPQNKVEEAKRECKRLIAKYGVDLISLGNGTASRESEKVIVELLQELDRPVQYVIVSEAGASVYSASKLATEEFPNFDVGQRSAASIARRLQDPLAELVKIDPKSIGVGQYQHDMNQKRLGEALEGVVETCVNRVGVDVNTASVSLLEYVSGINKTLAQNIVEYREANGQFTDREQLLAVAKLGPGAFEQCAGFLRIRDGNNPLDATGIHPESYAATKKLLEKLGLSLEDVRTAARAQGNLAGVQEASRQKNENVRKDMGKPAQGTGNLEKRIGDKARMAGELGIGELTLTDILQELEKPARDPREDMPRPVLRSDILEITDLKPGMILKGTVRNVIDFGVFVDIGVHQDGLVHISQISDRFLKHPLDAVSVGDVVEVQVLSTDPVKKRISLTMRINRSQAAN